MGGRKSDAISLKEIDRTEEQLHAKSSIRHSSCVHCFLPWRDGRACALNPCTEPMPETTETNPGIMRYTESLTPSATVAIKMGCRVANTFERVKDCHVCYGTHDIAGIDGTSAIPCVPLEISIDIDK